ncbi:MAG: 6-bladed beta-propeller [Thaumarchaeota archaeon]|nr:6-bladed beta-propeller [Nitrososphaerota archaeon]
MKRLALLFIIGVMIFVTSQNANAITITAIPEKQEFGPNDWIKIDLSIQGYNGGQINWTAHRPGNSIISGVIADQSQPQKIVHQIIRDANDNEFGSWIIDYKYAGINQTVHFNVQSLGLTVITDKITYYEPDTMNINITSSYFQPYAKFAHFYLLDFYDQDGNDVIGIPEIEITADKPSVLYHFPMLKFAKFNPPGLYTLKVHYFNSVTEIPFLLGDIHKLMELSVKNSDTIYPGNDVTFELLMSRITDSTGTIKITDPLGNTTSIKFSPQSVHDTIVLKNVSKMVGDYKFEINYAGVTKNGSFEVVQNPHQLPDIQVGIMSNKLNYRPGELANFKIHVSNVTANSISTWVTSPDGRSSSPVELPMNTTDIIIPHKIAQYDTSGQWRLYVNYDGIEKYSIFSVIGASIDDGKILNAMQYNIPLFVSEINSTTFQHPSNIAIDKNNNIYVINSGNSEIDKFNFKGNLLLSWGETGSSDGQFRNPSSIFVNEKYAYVTDTGNSRILMFNKTGSFVYSWGSYGTGPNMFKVPIAINSNHKNELFVGDLEQGIIQLFDNAGTYKDHIVSSLTYGESFTGIKSIAFDSQDNLYAITTDDRILKYSSIGEFVNFYGSSGNEEGRFNNPTAIAIDSKNNIFVADTDNHRIQKFDSDGNFLLSWGTEGTGQGQFEQPVGLAIDSSDNIYVIDKKNNNIQKFALYGQANKNIQPSWIKNTSVWWSEGVLDKNDFSLVIKYMINQGILKIPSLTQDSNIKIPSWLKGNIDQWSSGQIDDNTFWQSIQYLISTGIVKV